MNGHASNQHDADRPQMEVDSAGEDAVGTTEDPADHPIPDEESEEESAEPAPISDGDAVAGNPDSASPAEPALPDDVGPDAVPPGNAASNEYDK